MWGGGILDWNKYNPLRIGEEVVETTKLISVEPKMARNGQELIVTNVEKTFENTGGLALMERRDWIFKPEIEKFGRPPLWTPAIDSLGSDRLVQPTDASIQTLDFIQSPHSLFRFSALTFNSHKIHYSKQWCGEMEGYRDIVVHDPLNLINMLDFWRDNQEDDYSMPRSIRYRATAPFYVDEPYRALLEKNRERTSIRLHGFDGRGEVQVDMMGDVLD